MARDRKPLTVTIKVTILHQTEKAILASMDGGEIDTVWLPRSQITIKDKQDDSEEFEIIIPRWLAEKHDLLEEEE